MASDPLRGWLLASVSDTSQAKTCKKAGEGATKHCAYRGSQCGDPNWDQRQSYSVPPTNRPGPRRRETLKRQRDRMCHGHMGGGDERDRAREDVQKCNEKAGTITRMGGMRSSTQVPGTQGGVGRFSAVNQAEEKHKARGRRSTTWGLVVCGGRRRWWVVGWSTPAHVVEEAAENAPREAFTQQNVHQSQSKSHLSAEVISISLHWFQIGRATADSARTECIEP